MCIFKCVKNSYVLPSGFELLSPLGLFLVLRYLLEETTTLQTRQRSSPRVSPPPVYKESKLFSNFLEIEIFSC